MARTPRYVTLFRDALLAVRPKAITIPGTNPPVVGVPKIRETTRLHYNKYDFQELGRKHEYTFQLPEGHLLELSIQLYENDKDFWRLFAYSVVDGNKSSGMLFSVNLTTGRDDNGTILLQQKLKLATRGLTTDERSASVEALAIRLREAGLAVSEGRDVVFSPFEARTGSFTRSTAAVFIRDFVITAVLKGHYMANKGYSLPGLDDVAQPILAARSFTPSLVGEGTFDPTNSADARERAMAEVVRRPGQTAFREAVRQAYEGRCAVTGCDCSETVQAAHINSYLGPHCDYVENGLLLRVDIHLLFDRKRLAIDSRTMKIVLAPALKATKYRELDGKAVSVPKDPKLHPNREALDKHRQEAGL